MEEEKANNRANAEPEVIVLAEEPDAPIDLPQDDGSALDCSGLKDVLPNDLVAEITSTECENLAASNGLDGTKQTNCDDLSTMVCAIKQEVDAIAQNRALVIATNDESKCNDNNDPTHASMWSRILRYSQAITCILCDYDPFVATILKSGKYPQILMGAVQTGEDGTGYPQWVMPDDIPTEGSSRPVTSKGIIQAVSEAILSVWHLWEEYPEFTYFAQSYDNEDNSQNLVNQTATYPPSDGDTALVSNNGTDNNVLYTYENGAWSVTKVLGEDDKLTNFAVTHIVKGAYADKGVYYFHDGQNDTWQVMDVELGDLENRVEALETMFAQAVVGADEDKQYVIATAPDLATAENMACIEGKTQIVLITG